MRAVRCSRRGSWGTGTVKRTRERKREGKENATLVSSRSQPTDRFVLLLSRIPVYPANPTLETMEAEQIMEGQPQVRQETFGVRCRYVCKISGCALLTVCSFYRFQKIPILNMGSLKM